MRPGDGPIRTLAGPVTATNPLPSGLVDSAGAELGTATNPIRNRATTTAEYVEQKFCANDSVPANAIADLWQLGTTANPDVWWVPGGFKPTAVSTEAADTGELTIFGISAVDGTEITETKAMTGTTPITFTGSYNTIYRAYYEDGDLIDNAGNITISDVATSTPRAYIGAGDGQTLMAFYCVPAGKIGYLLRYEKSVGKGDEIAVQMKTASAGSSWRVRETLRGGDGMISHVWADYNNPGSGLLLQPGTRVKALLLRVGGTRCSVSFSIALFDEPLS